MRIIDCEQGSEEWLAARAGKVTASRIADVMAKGAGGKPSATRARYMGEIISERLTGKRAEEGFKSKAMEAGNEREPAAADHYAFIADTPLAKVGFVLHPTIDHAGASPDRLAGEHGIVQIKCPDRHTHIANLRGEKIDGGYIKQVQFELACTGRDWCDFVSFNPDFPLNMRMKIARIARDPVMIVEAERAVREFLAEVEATIADLCREYQSEAAE